ncbi:MAG: hypothetical protein JST70_04680 [Bacteroidetes bacterium]|nr:hypothetical protein [Bacteroidota bacterium]
MQKLLAILACTVLLLFTAQAAPDTLTLAEKKSLAAAFEQSPIADYQRFFHWSKLHDTAKASEYLLKTNPYLLMWEWADATNADSMLRTESLTENARKTFAAAYAKERNGKRSASYTSFYNMTVEDQAVRNSMDKCADTTSCRLLARRMRVTDSIHAAYLYSYVQQNGWPTLENGSMPAMLLAIHDHAHHTFYKPYIQAAVLKGQADLSGLMLINMFIKNNTSDGALEKALATGNVIKYNISEMLTDRMPAALGRIQKKVKELCGTRYRRQYIFYTPRKIESDDWCTKQQHTANCIIVQFQKELQPACKISFRDEEVWDVRHEPSEKRALYLVFYGFGKEIYSSY